MEDLDQNNDDYVFTLSEKSKKIAKDELNETDAERLGSVQTLRQWVLEQKWLKSPVDFKFLLRFLRVKKFSQLAARRTLERYWSARTKTPEWFQDVDTADPAIQELLDTGFYLVLPGVDSKRRKIMVERIGMLDVEKYKKKYGSDVILKTTMAIVDWIMMDENVQVNGLAFISDLTDFSVKHHMMLYTTEVTKKTLEIYQDGYPCRTKAMHIYNEPPIFDPLMAVIKPFMKKKMRDRIFMHGKKMPSLYKETDMYMFPTEYLPDEYTGPTPGSCQDVIDYMKREMTSAPVREHIKALSSGRYGVDVTLKPQEVEQASFRKLNI